MNKEELKDCIRKFKVTGINRYFEDIYNYFLPKIYRFFVFQLYDSNIAQDLSSEVFLKVYKYLPKLNLDFTRFEAWIYKIAKNQLIDHYRKNKKSVKDISLDYVMEEKHDDVAGPYTAFSEEFLKSSQDFYDIESSNTDGSVNISAFFSNEKLIKAFEMLPDLYKQVLILKFTEDMDSRAIGRILNKTETAVRALKFRAVSKLRENMIKKR